MKKGPLFEAQVCPLLENYWPGTIRRGKQGAKDKGEFYMPGNDLYIAELKNRTTLSLPAWWRETEIEAANAGVPHGVLVVKRKGKTAPEEQWAIQTLGKWLEIVHRSSS